MKSTLNCVISNPCVFTQDQRLGTALRGAGGRKGAISGLWSDV